MHSANVRGIKYTRLEIEGDDTSAVRN